MPCPICTLSSCAPQDWIPLGSLGAGQDSEGKAHHPWSMTSLPRCCGLAGAGLEGAREEPAGTGAWHPAPRLSPALAAAAPRLLLAAAPAWARSMLWASAMRQLGILQQSPGRQSRKRGLPSVSFSVSLTTVHTKEAMKKLAESQATSMIPNMTDRVLDPTLWTAFSPASKAVVHFPCPWSSLTCGPGHSIAGTVTQHMQGGA